MEIRENRNKINMHIEFTTTLPDHVGITSCTCAEWENNMDALIADLLICVNDLIAVEKFQNKLTDVDMDIITRWKEYNQYMDCRTILSFRYMIESHRDFLILLTKYHLNGIYNLVFYDGDACFSSGQARDIFLSLTTILASTERNGEYKEWLESLVCYMQDLNYATDFEMMMKIER